MRQTQNDLAIGADLLSASTFASRTFKTAGGEVITAPPLPESVKSVYVRAEANRLSSNPNDLILLSFPVDLTQPGIIQPSDQTVVLDEYGAFVTKSRYNLGYRVGFFGDSNEPQHPVQQNNYQVGTEDEIFGPVSGVRVSINETVFPGGVGVSRSDGHYSFSGYLPICPVGGFDFSVDIYAELRYQNFLPIGAPSIPYYLRRQSWEYCYATLNSFGLYQAFPTNVSTYQHNFYVDVMVLTGQVYLLNHDGSGIPVGSDTQYQSFSEAESEAQTYHYDFNGDGVKDTVVKGTVKTLTDPDTGEDDQAFVAEGASPHWEAGDEADLQGVYFEAPTEADQAPDLVRLLDTTKRLDQQAGELTSISLEDLRNTDILVFRESTGKLVTARTGLTDGEANGRRSLGVNQDKESVAYRILLRGPKDSNLNIGGGARSGSYSQWASDNLMTEPFQAREADHLKPGETVRVVAINRATGYMGTARTQLTSAGDGGQINVNVPPIALAPPNLKIWAERDYYVEGGLTQGEDRQYLIGAEGAALTSDTVIKVYSQWFDRDGSALPDDLGLDDGEQYGLTGRLAKIVADNTLAGSSDLANFPIGPGLKTQVIRVGDNLTQAEHFYIHVSGTPKDNSPSFDGGQQAEPYTSRPDKLTPFLVPLYNEEQNWQDYQTYRQLKQAAEEAGTPDSAPLKPLPAYAWQYRPEYQFSQFDLEIEALNRVQNVGTETESTTNIIGQTSPTISSSDDLIQALYSLIGSNYERLTPVDGQQELVLIWEEGQPADEHERILAVAAA